MITTQPAGLRVKVSSKGEVIAESSDAIALKEGSYPVVYYIPRKDVKMDRLEPTQHHTHCPHKGDASYFSLKGGAPDSVWSYEQPFDGVKQIAGLLAFYPDKFDITAS